MLCMMWYCMHVYYICTVNYIGYNAVYDVCRVLVFEVIDDVYCCEQVVGDCPYQERHIGEVKSLL